MTDSRGMPEIRFYKVPNGGEKLSHDEMTRLVTEERTLYHFTHGKDAFLSERTFEDSYLHADSIESEVQKRLQVQACEFKIISKCAMSNDEDDIGLIRIN